ncbi:hypothetical protein PHK61_12630 [Actinomycetospora lutea]|uniref:hypothetical protein n=1 Tax=Actinomycetospora lutea TaxID=663604 RepID=UPI002365DD7D|nr:hypothetical protein [Actinomycetospora lutea]MDD7939261.1 hypothetical protein [Actinomycetospora lutea]
MDRWTMVLEAVPGSLRAVRVHDDHHRPIDVELADGDAGTLSASLLATVEVEGGRPDHLVLVVPGDLDEERFAALTEAVRLARFPEPSWLPDAVSWAGEHLAGWGSGTPVTVVDTRGDDLVAWPIRTADDGVAIGEGAPLDLGGRLDALLTGVVHAKLAVVAPGIAEALRLRTDAVGRRDAAHLGHELHEARRLMSATDGEELVVTAGDAEVYVTREEFTGLVDQALRDTVEGTVAEDAAHTLVVAPGTTPIVEQLAATPGGAVLPAPAGTTSLDGAAALVLPRPHGVDDPTPTDGLRLPGRAPRETAVVPLPRETSGRDRLPIWAVPALAGLLVLSLAGAGTVLATAPVPGPAPAADAGSLSPVVPVGFDRAGGDGGR